MVPFVNVTFSYSDYWRFFGGYLRVIISTFVVKILEDKLLSLEVPGERVGQRTLRKATPAGDDLDHSSDFTSCGLTTWVINGRRFPKVDSGKLPSDTGAPASRTFKTSKLKYPLSGFAVSTSHSRVRLTLKLGSYTFVGSPCSLEPGLLTCVILQPYFSLSSLGGRPSKSFIGRLSISAKGLLPFWNLG